MRRVRRWSAGSPDRTGRCDTKLSGVRGAGARFARKSRPNGPLQYQSVGTSQRHRRTRHGRPQAPHSQEPTIATKAGCRPVRPLPSCAPRRKREGAPPGFPAALTSIEIRRRPTLPGGLPPSTIGADRLNFRVRDGNGCDPVAMATEISCQRGRATSRTPEQARAVQSKPSAD